MTYSLAKVIGFANTNVCCNNKLYSSSLQSTKVLFGWFMYCVLPIDPENKLKKKLKNSSKKLQKLAFFETLVAGNAFKKEA